MRLVFVNHYHPDAPHIGAARLREFAQAMAGRGHRVVLFTETLGGGPAMSIGEVAARLDAQDWSRPLVVACAPRPAPLLGALRDGRLPRPLRMALIAGLYLAHGGVFPDWWAGARPYLRVLAKRFQPQACWATFGNTEALRIAQALARDSGCPWVMDVKDAWDVFLPAPLRRRVARRFADARAVTALSDAYVGHTAWRFPAPATVIRSGFPLALLCRPPAEGPAPARITLTGSVYAAATLDGLIRGVRGWLDTLPPGERGAVTFTYAGTDHARVAQAAGTLGCTLDVRPFIPLDELAALQRDSFINLYACIGVPGRFHHKLFELLAAGRPIACLPAEGPEALDLVARTRGRLASCGDADAVAGAIGQAWAARSLGPVDVDRDILADFSWERQAERLEAVLTGVSACG